MLVRENLVSRNVLTKWTGYKGSDIKLENGIVFASAGTENNTILKTYINILGGLSVPLKTGKDYSCIFYFENLREYPISLRFNGLDIPAYDIERNFKGVVTVSGRRISDTNYPQIQVRSHNPAYYVQFKCDNLMLVENEKPSDLYIVAKADLPTNQQGYYPQDGDYNEIEAI